MDRIALALLAAFTGFDIAAAATLTNSGADAIVVQITDENGRYDLSLDAGASEDVCPAGCFLTLPNGDRIGLGGQEKVNISGGAASVE